MTTGIILAGLTLAAVGFAGRYAFRVSKQFSEKFQHLKIPTTSSFANSKYYKGGFEPKMTRREAGLILGISPSATNAKIVESYKRIMVLNHPDRGGSPYLAAKIGEAKDLLSKGK
ncbi:mitochondrial import inner membrane translocase subunit TIM14-like [Centruroides sculpturatus]|uniref:mitochondrial import inner membrane translocase subunit TIM14-like n=1 Tax=Centruroides sculpturatus TaxID=218467 RepID=UPI000C6D3014|nr:mitochondrial import inner membrane translocase subunit TIM14-like [Centruroides sculpturatus]